jgi:hypothetical protein
MRDMFVCLAIGMLGTVVPAVADTLKLSNCTESFLEVKTYNEQDGLCLIARSATDVPGCSSVTLDCVGKCKVAVGALPIGTCHLPILSGEKTYTKDKSFSDTSYLRGLSGTAYFSRCQCGMAALN